MAPSERAARIAEAGSLDAALESGTLGRRVTVTLSEAVVLGLLRQDVRTFLTVLGHGSTDLGEILRVYEAAGLVRTCGMRNEISATHAATALRWVTGKKAAVVTSIGPGALQALAASLAAASDGIGVWHIYGDETTEDEGPNMQQIPKPEQGLYLRLCSTMGAAYSLHTPLAVGTALRRGLNVVDDPYRGGPFYLLLPLNTQPAMIEDFNLDELPAGAPPSLGAAADGGRYAEAASILRSAQRVVVKVGGGARRAGMEIVEILELVDGVAVTSPLVSGVIPYDHPRNMTVGGTKGSISGNYAMEHADCLLAVGTRAVCQSDCSRTGYPQVLHVVNINADASTALHYERTTALVGDAAATLRRLCEELRVQSAAPVRDSDWFKTCADAKVHWEEFKAKRYRTPILYDTVWDRDVLTQPAALALICDWARARDAVTFFDAGDVQANGFQVVEDDRVGRTFTETGASYMGFAASALSATGLATEPFYGVACCGDGSFLMNPQVLVEGVAHGARGVIVVLDNRRMAAISSLQEDQYGIDHATADGVAVDYVALAASVAGVRGLWGGTGLEELRDALDAAHGHNGLSLVHVPVYYGPNELGSLGAYGRWNVGSWVTETQRIRHEIGL